MTANDRPTELGGPLTPEEQKNLAWHEVGHAVVCLHFGVDVVAVSIEHDVAVGSAGHVEHGVPADAHTDAVIAVGGLWCSVIHGGVPLAEALDDAAADVEDLNELGYQALDPNLRRECLAILRAHQHVTRALTRILLRRGSLDASDIGRARQLVRSHAA